VPDERTIFEIPRRLERGQAIDDLTKGETERFLRIYYQAYYLVAPEKTKLLPQVLTTLQVLSKKAKLALVTMRHVSKEDLRQELECFGISKYFTHIVTGLDTPKPKPSPEALIECVKVMDLEMCDCIIAGDSVNDVRAGKAAGAKTVAVLSGIFRCEELAMERPDLILPDVTVLPDHIF